MTPSASLTALEMASVAVTNAATLTPSGPANAVVHSYERFNGACIELNRASGVSDFVPALQAEFMKNGVDSRVYETALPSSCRFSIHYTTQIEWGRRLFSGDYSPYMSSARIELRDNGRLLAASSYKPAMLGYDRWATTQEKIAPSVRVLAYGVADGKQVPSATK
jgi:hypothetical protein